MYISTMKEMIDDMCVYYNRSKTLANYSLREDEDEEAVEWEQEQLRRGGHTATDFLNNRSEKHVYKAAPGTYLMVMIVHFE